MTNFDQRVRPEISHDGSERLDSLRRLRSDDGGSLPSISLVAACIRRYWRIRNDLHTMLASTSWIERRPFSTTSIGSRVLTTSLTPYVRGYAGRLIAIKREFEQRHQG